ncbi:MAG TPA: peptidoglycan DD-metalloendopeptidase family protein, partial [Burkholderiales bacterium]|nr:peptidoglycan DD-metalloendopeptidase family protein [Burkholderiales bacterium]
TTTASPAATAPVTAAQPTPPPAAAAPSTPAAPPASVAAPAPATAPPPAAVAARPAPVRAVEQPVIRPYREGDWRPEFYTVKRGDTLYSIALDHGQDYRDVAAWNALADPAYIQVDQRLRLFPPGGTAEAVSPEPVALPPASLPAPMAETVARVIPLISEPKVRKLPYTDRAVAELTAPRAAPTAAVAAAPSPQPAPAPPRVEAPAAPRQVQAGVSAQRDERLAWEWPTSGRIRYGFGQGSNQKGVGIDGNKGQPVVASAPGRVVYSGSGLRGYGNLIIIKHNPTYLSVYAHNSQLLVKEGQSVAQGQKIAEMGDSDSERVTLHFEIRRLGKPVDPLQHLPEKAS